VFSDRPDSGTAEAIGFCSLFGCREVSAGSSAVPRVCRARVATRQPAPPGLVSGAQFFFRGEAGPAR